MSTAVKVNRFSMSLSLSTNKLGCVLPFPPAIGEMFRRPFTYAQNVAMFKVKQSTKKMHEAQAANCESLTRVLLLR